MSAWDCRYTSSSGILRPRACKWLPSIRGNWNFARASGFEKSSSNANRDHCFEDCMSKQRAVVLLSGGMDSCVCAALAKRDYDAAALHIQYGQRTEARELNSFHVVCDRLGITDRLVFRN